MFQIIFICPVRPRVSSPMEKNCGGSKESDNQSKQGLDHFFKTSFVSLQQGGFLQEVFNGANR